jgi:NDP-sugar pyrophosphorylase family protein
MAPVGGRYFLEYLLVWLRSAGIRELILCVGYRNSQIRKWLGDGRHWGLHVRYSVERNLLGTAGALKLAARMVTAERCLVLNGDSFLGVDLQEMYRFHRSHGALATIAIARVRDSVRYGTVQLGRDGQITAFRQKNTEPGSHPAPRGRFHLINGGVYLLEKRFFGAIPPAKAFSLEKEIIPRLVNRKLYGFVTRGYFIDIGVPADFEKAQVELPGRFSP